MEEVPEASVLQTGRFWEARVSSGPGRQISGKDRVEAELGGPGQGGSPGSPLLHPQVATEGQQTAAAAAGAARDAPVPVPLLLPPPAAAGSPSRGVVVSVHPPGCSSAPRASEVA